MGGEGRGVVEEEGKKVGSWKDQKIAEISWANCCSDTEMT